MIGIGSAGLNLWERLGGAEAAHILQEGPGNNAAPAQNHTIAK